MLTRMQILFDEETKRDLISLSEIKNQSISKLVRDFVAPKIKEEKKKARSIKKISGAEALLKMAEEAEKIDKKYESSGPTDVSANIDHYLYGRPKKKAKKRK